MPGYPYTSWIGLIGLLIIIISMPLIPGQTSGLVVGIIFTFIFAGIYQIKKILGRYHESHHMGRMSRTQFGIDFSHEFSEELTQGNLKNKTESDGTAQSGFYKCEENEQDKNEPFSD
jgi:amino acid permease